MISFVRLTFVASENQLRCPKTSTGVEAMTAPGSPAGESQLFSDSRELDAQSGLHRVRRGRV